MAGIVQGLVAGGLLAAALSAPAAPLLIDDVHGYTLAAGGLNRFGAMLIDAGKVVQTGDGRDLRARYPRAQRIDGHGATLLPGLIDAHGHVLSMGTAMTRIDLAGTRSLAEAQRQVRKYAQAHPERKWLTGRGWNQVIWKLGRFPTAANSTRLRRPARRARARRRTRRMAEHGRVAHRGHYPLDSGSPAAGASSMMRTATRMACWSTMRWSWSARPCRRQRTRSGVQRSRRRSRT